MYLKKIMAAAIASSLCSTTLVEAQHQGLHNNTKHFTDPDDIEISDMDNPQQIMRTWDAAIIRIPQGIGRSKRTSFEELKAEFGSGKRKFPTAIYMHGCSGIWPGTLQRVKFLADSGFLVIAPASMARTVYAQSCNPSTHDGGMFRPVLGMRQLDAGYAIETAKTLPYVDPDNMVLIGLSEGGIVTAKFTPRNERQKVSARVVEGWTCNAGWFEYAGMNAPKDEPVLTLVGAGDPWFQDEWTKGSCGAYLHKDNGSKSIVYETGQLARRHELLEFSSVQEDTLAFLREHIDLPLSVRAVQKLLKDLGYDPGPVRWALGIKNTRCIE